MGVRLPNLTNSQFDSNKVIEALVEAEGVPIETAKKRREDTKAQKAELQKLVDNLNEFDTSLNQLKTKSDFYKMKVESSHPDIIDGIVEKFALVGSYEFEVRGVARADKELAYGFPDKNDTPVGFGYLEIERDDMEDPIEVVIEPNSTLQDVANQINDSEAGVRAMVINTKIEDDVESGGPYRLLVISEKSGKEARVNMDPDTTFLEFKEQVVGSNLDILFEDVPVTDEDNTLEDLLDGVTFNVKRSEPGTRIQVQIAHDVENTVTSIQTFVEKYNQIADFVHKQFELDPETNKAGILAADSSIKTVMRQLQNTLALPTNTGGKYRTLADIGITTDPKTAKLQMDDSKVQGALAEDYESVAKLFVRSPSGDGLAGRLAEKLKQFRDPVSGVMKARMRGLDQVIKSQDEDIVKKEGQLEQREQMLRRRFTALEGQLASAQSQSSFLAGKFGGGGQGAGG